LLLDWKTVMAGCGLGRKPESPTVVEELEHVFDETLQAA
jgi:hypothetical protein